MKRHPSLIPLSHDHHEGLILAQRLKLGRSKSPRSDWPKDRKLQRDRTLAFFESTLIEHFRLEETYLFPLAAKHVPNGADLISDLLDEHRKLEEYVRAMRENREDPEDLLVSFARLLEQHIRREERVLFQEVQAHVPESLLAETGRYLKES